MNNPWGKRRLSDICILITKGSTPTTYGFEFIEYRHDAVMFIGAYNCSTDGTVKTDTKKWICPDANKLLKRSILNEGDSIFCIVGNTIGSSFNVHKSILPANINQNVAVIRPDTTALNPQYLHHVLRSDLIQNQVTKEASTQAQPSLSLKQIGDFEVYLPDLPDQTKIAQILSTWDKAITATERLLANNRQQKQALMQQLLTGQKRLHGFSDKWAISTLTNHCKVGTGAKDLQDKNDGGLYPFFVRSQNIERIDSYSFDGEAILIPGDGRVGEIFHYINGKFDFHQRVYKISNFSGVDGKYIYYLLCIFFKKEVVKNTAKATVDSLRMPVFTGMKIFLPSLPEQQKIAQVLSTADAEISNLQAQLAKLKLEKKALMQQLLTGQRRVKLDAEVAA